MKGLVLGHASIRGEGTTSEISEKSGKYSVTESKKRKVFNKCRIDQLYHMLLRGKVE